MGLAPSKPDPSRSLEVINASYGRTGTVSITYALEKLLRGPVHHGGSQVIQIGGEHGRIWVDAWKAKHAGDKEQCLKLLRKGISGFCASADLPSIYFVPELLELFPDAKVLLVERDPDTWWKSFEPVLAIFDNWYLPYIVAIQPNVRHMPAYLKEWKIETDEALKRDGRQPGKYGSWLIEAHNKMIKEIVPKERLLVMRTSELAWRPLCKFLGKPVPDEPFPHVNEAEIVKRGTRIYMAGLLAKWAVLLSTVAGGAYLGLKWIRK